MILSVRICPACSREYGDGVGACVDDGATLVLLDTAANERVQELVGQVVDGRYRIERIVGRGGMGTVYACRHVVVGKAFAMKVLRGGIERSEEILQRFIREAQAANAIKSRHICEMTDFGQLTNGAFYIVMELLEGESLTRALREKHLTRRDIKHVFIQIAETLQKAHDAGIVHRDLKPDNVVLVRDESDPFFVKLVDFGIAKVLETRASNLTDTGVILGTPYYMSPEQARGDAIDHRSDIYSLGIMMYRAFTGKLPFLADTAMGVLTRHLTQTPELPSRLADVDRATEEIILRCLEKRANDRFPSMTVVASALAALEDVVRVRLEEETTGNQPTPIRNSPAESYDSDADDNPRRFTPTQLATPRALAVAAAGPASADTVAGSGRVAATRTAADSALATPAPQTRDPQTRNPQTGAAREFQPPPLSRGPSIPAPMPLPGQAPSVMPLAHARHLYESRPPEVAPHGTGPAYDVGTGEPLPAHLFGESNTNRALVSSRMTGRPPAPAQRATISVAVAVLALTGFVIGAVVMLGDAGAPVPLGTPAQGATGESASSPGTSTSADNSNGGPAEARDAFESPNGAPNRGSSAEPGAAEPSAAASSAAASSLAPEPSAAASNRAASPSAASTTAGSRNPIGVERDSSVGPRVPQGSRDSAPGTAKPKGPGRPTPQPGIDDIRSPF